MPLKSLPTEVLPSKSWLIIIGLLAFSYFCFVIIEPYINPIILAFIFALLAKPMQSKFMQILNNRINLATMLNLTCIVLIVFIPLSFVLFTIIKQGVGFSQGVYLWSTKGGANELLANHTVQKIIELIQQFFPSDQLTSENIIRLIATKSSAAAGQFLSISTNILGNFANFLVKFALMLFIMFFFIRDQDKILAYLHHISPLSKSQEDRLLSEVEQVAKSSIFGSFATALVQGVLGGIAMYICGFPALLWGAIIAFASFIPIIGTAIIWLPFAIYLFITGNWEYGAFLVGWGICVIGMVDNFLRPMLMKGSGDDNMSTLIIFLSLLGGINYFGLLGLIYGPMVFSITIVFLRLYEMNFKNFLTDQDNS